MLKHKRPCIYKKIMNNKNTVEDTTNSDVITLQNHSDKNSMILA